MADKTAITAWIKRIADASEKFAVGSFLVGAYQGEAAAFVAGSIFLVASMFLTDGR